MRELPGSGYRRRSEATRWSVRAIPAHPSLGVDHPNGRHARRRLGVRSAGLEELEDAPGEQLGRVRVVRRQARVGDVVLIPGVEEELRVLCLLDEGPGGVEVALVDEERIRAMDLPRSPRRMISSKPISFTKPMPSHV